LFLDEQFPLHQRIKKLRVKTIQEISEAAVSPKKTAIQLKKGYKSQRLYKCRWKFRRNFMNKSK
jgi:hypothetical protein